MKKKRRVHRNRELVLSLDDILSNAMTLSGAGHPHDSIDAKTATARFCRRKGKLNVIIKWEGYPIDAEDYGK